METLNDIQQLIYPSVNLFLLIYCLVAVKGKEGKLFAIAFGMVFLADMASLGARFMMGHDYSIRSLFAVSRQIGFFAYLCFGTFFVLGLSQIIKPKTPKSSPSDKLNSVGSTLAYLSVLFIGIFLLLVGVLLTVEFRLDGWAFGVIAIGGVLTLSAQIYLMVMLYRMWGVVIDASSQLQLVPSIETPGKAVGYLFIPLFSLYWLFIAFGRLPKDLNAIAKKRGTEQTASEGLGIAIAIFSVLSLVPFFGLIAVLINVFILIPVFVNQSIMACETEVLTAVNLENDQTAG